MNYSVVFVLVWFSATTLIIPKSIDLWFRWKKNRKTRDLTIAVTGFILAFFLLSGLFVFFIQTVTKWTNYI